jgi:3-carboxy-cis,cis-muconate cycloisomerase
MTAHLIDSLATTDALAAVFSDSFLLQSMLDFEAALARVEARLGVIPSRAADAISAAAVADGLDAAAIARAARESGTPAIALVQALVARVHAADPESARFVHWGATSQDVVDTAFILALGRAHQILAADHARLTGSLRQLSDRYAGTIMLGRTLLQAAPPVTFGLKLAGWFAALKRGWRRVHDAFGESEVLQFGGAVGTLAALGPNGVPVHRGLAEELGLKAEPSWHTHRDRFAVVITNCGLYTGGLGKIARDLSLLMQDEVGELVEKGGGSSSMPHKRNPVASAIALAAETRMPGLVAAFLTGMVQEHERAVGGWHAEWPTLSAAIQCTGAALAALADVVDDDVLTVDTDRMRANIEETHGVIFAERAMMLLVPSLGKEVASQLVTDAVQHTRATGQPFAAVLGSMPEIARVIPQAELQNIDDPEAYLGAAEALRVQMLA